MSERPAFHIIDYSGQMQILQQLYALKKSRLSGLFSWQGKPMPFSNREAGSVLLSGYKENPAQIYAYAKSCRCSKKGASQSIPGFSDPNASKINAEAVKDSFCTA
jgi:hypothetical protein